MAFTGVGTDEQGKATKFRVENSWGESEEKDKSYKAHLLMTVEWFREYGFEVVVDKKHVPDQILRVFDVKPIVLPAWDPMGSIG